VIVVSEQLQRYCEAMRPCPCFGFSHAVLLSNLRAESLERGILRTGRRNQVWKDCQRLPRDERDRIERMDELYGFLDQSNISPKNIARLEILAHARHDPPLFGR
jgi:hypothetical protein